MGVGATAVVDEHIRAMAGVLRAWNPNGDDFAIEWHEACELGRLLALDGVITIRCHTTGTQRIYPTGAESAYLGQFLMDLAQGRFAEKAQSAVAA